MDKVVFSIPTFLGLHTRGDETETPYNALRALENFTFEHEHWRRKRGRAKYNAAAMHATEEVRGLDGYIDANRDSLMVAVCNAKIRKTTSDGDMGSDLTLPDGTAVSFTNGNLDIYGIELRGLLYLFNGDTSDYVLMCNGTNAIDNARYQVTKDATGGTTTTLIDTVNLTQADDYWNGLFISMVKAGVTHRAWITDFDAATDTITFAPAAPWTIDNTVDYTIAGAGIWREKNGKYAILHGDRIFAALGSLLHFTERTWPDEWNSIATGYPNIKEIGWNDKDGDITALVSLDEYVIVFKPHNIYVVHTTVGDPDFWPVYKITGTNSNKGAVWHRTVATGFGGIIYMSWDGIYVITRDLNVKCVSRYIDPTIKALVQSTTKPGGLGVIEKIDTIKADFDAGTLTNIDTAEVSGTFRTTKTDEAMATNSGVSDSYIGAYDYILAQSFKVPIDCFCTKVKIRLDKIGSPPSWTMYIKADNGGLPGDTLGSGVITWSPSYGTAIMPNIPLTANTTYHLYTPKSGDVDNHYKWHYQYNTNPYADGVMRISSGGGWTTYPLNDLRFTIYEQHYESSANLISRIHNLGAVPTAWAPFSVIETLYGCSVVYQVRSDDDSGMASPTAWENVENGGIPTITLQQYVQSKTIFTPTNIATPVIDEIIIRAYTGTAVDSPCGIVWNKGYELCVRDTGSDVNNVVYRLDEESWMYRVGPDGHPLERWAKKTGIEATKFIIFSNNLVSGSVGGTGKGGFLYYEDTGTKDLGVDFTASFETARIDFSSKEHPTYRERDKIFKRLFSKYKSQQDASLYHKEDAGSWSSAITLGAHTEARVEEDYFRGLARGKYLTMKYEQTAADPDLEVHTFDIEAYVVRRMG